MQSGGSAAGIQLQVGLDLAYFRSQLPSLGKAAAGYPLIFNVQFDRLGVQKELNALGRNIRQRTYRLEVKTNLSTEIELASKLAAALDNLARSRQAAKASVDQQLGVGAIGRTPSQGGLGSKDVEKLYRASAKAGLLAFNSEVARSKVAMVAAMEAVGFDAIAGLLNGLSSQDTRLRAAAEYLGATLIKVAKTSLGIASPSKEFEKIGKNVGEGFEKGVLSSMDKAFNALEAKMRQRGRILDTVARGIFKMLGMDPAAMLQQAREQRTASIRAPIAGLLPEYTSRGTREETIRQLREGGPPVAQGPGMLALSNEALGRRVNAILQEYFKVAEVQVRESFDPRELKRSLNVFSYIAQSLRDAEARTKQAKVAESVDSLMRAIDNAIKVAQARVRISSVQVSELGPRAQAALPAGRVAGFLPGRPSQASILELNNILAGAIREYFAAVARGIKPTFTLQGRLMLGAGSTVAGLLPPAGGTTPTGQMRFNTVSTGAVLGEQQFMRAPNVPSPMGAGSGITGLSTQLPAGYHNVNKLIASLREADKYLQKSRVPLTGAIAELGSQFGNAVKQVLLFGTAYKALAFIIDIPKQAFDATKSLQLFENQIGVLTGSAAEADRAFGFIDDLVARFNIPLQSARQGFAQLYASMSPAGIPIGEVENLFQGMSTAAATLGMSSAQMDRMTLAFSQMASKGKIMTEEVTRQLGDVLPGALAKMAKAAQMEIPAFIDAMQKGQLSGKAMQDVLFNMGILMQTDFAEGASNAAKLLQGAMNSIGNSIQRMYEAFRPVVENLAAQAMPALAQIIQDITKGVQAFASSFSGANTPINQLNTTAQNVFNTLKGLQEIFKAIKVVIDGIAPAFGLLGQVIFSTAEQISRFINTPFGGALTNWLTTTLTLTAALVAFTKIGILGAGAAVLRLVQQIQLLIAKKIALAAVTTNVKLGLIGLAGAVVIGAIVALSNALQGPANRLREIEERITKVKKSFDDLAAAGDVSTLTVEVSLAKTEEAQLKQRVATLQKQLQLPLIGGGSERASLQASFIKAEEQYAEAIEKRRAAEISLKNATKVAAPALPDLRKVTLEGGDQEKEKKLARFYEEQSRLLQGTLNLRIKELEAQRLSGEISEYEFKTQKALLELGFERKIIAEGLKVALQRLADENLSSADKDLKSTQLRKEAALDLANAEKSSALDIEKARKDLGKVFDPVQNKIEIEKQEALIDSLSKGFRELTPDVQAYFDVREKLIDVHASEALLIQSQIDGYRSQREEIYQNARALAFLNEELDLQNRLKLAGILDPRIELRTRLGQERPEFSPDKIEKIATLQETIAEIEKARDQLKSIAASIGDAFGEAFKGIVTGTSSAREALANFFQSVADAFADMVAQMISQWLQAQLLQGFASLFPGGGGGNLGSTASNLNKYAPLLPMANGGIAPGGFQAFANGGIVKGPTLGLVGEGRYNEAVIPLPDGKSVPVDLAGATGNQITSNIVVNVSSDGRASSSGADSVGLGRKIEGAVKQVIVEELRPGGVLAGRR